jgi:hypothetical protein
VGRRAVEFFDHQSASRQDPADARHRKLPFTEAEETLRLVKEKEAGKSALSRRKRVRVQILIKLPNGVRCS